MKRIYSKTIPAMPEFQKWLIECGKKGKNTSYLYCRYLKRLIKDIEEFAPEIDLTESEKNYLEVVPAFIKEKVEYKAIIVIDLLLNNLNKATGDSSAKNLSDDKSALKAYKAFIETKMNDSIFVDSLETPDYDALMPYRRELMYIPSQNTNKGDFDKIDGMDSLVELFGNATKAHKQFIKKVLSESFFFTSKLCKDRFNNYFKPFSDSSIFIARWSNLYKDKDLFHNMNKDQIIKYSKNNPIDYPDSNSPLCKIILDTDGNKEVRKFINDETGYWISNGADNSQFIGFKISHIWGNAWDPRFFSNIWNIAIVPAWANDLLDKSKSKSSLIHEMIGTFKEICIKHYEMNNLPWGQLKMAQPGLDSSDVVLHDNYTINVINEIQPGQKYGVISKVDICI